jgi:preprotein translocase subunit SecG
MFYELLSPLYPFVVVLHVTLCILLVLIILLQPGKGGDVGSAFGGGGGGGGVFGPRGPASLLSRATTGVAVLFMVTSITLALSANQSFGDGSLDVFLQEDASEATGGLDLAPPDDAAGTPDGAGGVE